MSKLIAREEENKLRRLKRGICFWKNILTQFLIDIMKTKINNHNVEEILRWVEWKGIDILYDLFDEKKLIDDSRFAKYITNNS